MELDELKRKLRQLKKLEAKIRFGETDKTKPFHYIWDTFFCLRDGSKSSVRYQTADLLRMDRVTLKEVFEEYFYCVYFQYNKENGLATRGVYDPNLLSDFGLPLDATLKDIKKQFRDLAKKHHPDHGGDSSQFIALYQAYQKLMDGK